MEEDLHEEVSGLPSLYHDSHSPGSLQVIALPSYIFLRKDSGKAELMSPVAL